MKAVSVAVALATLSLFACGKFSPLSFNDGALTPQLKETALKSVTVQGTVHTQENTEVEFKAMGGKAVRYSSSGNTVNVQLSNGIVNSCTERADANGANAFVIVRLPADVAAGSAYTAQADVEKTGEYRVSYNTLIPNGFTQDPFESFTVTILEVDATHVHGFVTAKGQVGAKSDGKTGMGSVEGEFNVPFCEN